MAADVSPGTWSLMTVPEVAAALRLSRSKTYELVASGRLESVTIDRSRRVTPDAMQRFLVANTQAAVEADMASEAAPWRGRTGAH
jgi:excisionase family DNA binding protein